MNINIDCGNDYEGVRDSANYYEEICTFVAAVFVDEDMQISLRVLSKVLLGEAAPFEKPHDVATTLKPKCKMNKTNKCTQEGER